MIATRMASSAALSRSSSIRSSMPEQPPPRGIDPLTARRPSHKRAAAALSAVAALALTAFAFAASAGAAPPRPGAPVYVRPVAVAQVLQRNVDFARCAGIQRFGKVAGSFVVFECRTQLDARVCRGVRVRSVRGSRSGVFRLVTLRRGTCS